MEALNFERDFGCFKETDILKVFGLLKIVGILKL